VWDTVGGGHAPSEQRFRQPRAQHHAVEAGWLDWIFLYPFHLHAGQVDVKDAGTKPAR
jgi:hypothetical protein